MTTSKFFDLKGQTTIVKGSRKWNSKRVVRFAPLLSQCDGIQVYPRSDGKYRVRRGGSTPPSAIIFLNRRGQTSLK